MDREKESDSFLSVSMLGDIREDIQFLGLTLKDITWIAGTTFICGGLAYFLPLSFWFKIVWLLIVFLISLMGRYLKWPYRFKRLRLYMRQSRQEQGENLPNILGIEEDGWFYRSFKDIHIVMDVKAPPWSTALLAKKRNRLAGYENFLRACVREGFEATVSSEQIPDFRHEIWNAMRDGVSPSPGVEKLKNNRIQMWEQLANSGAAQRSEYTLKLTINETSIAIRERDDEPVGLSKEQTKRYRMVAELREKLNRVLRSLEMSGHKCSILSGYATSEILGRWWDRTFWEEWKAREGNWVDPNENLELEQDDVKEKDNKPKRNARFNLKSFMIRIGGKMGVIKKWFKIKKNNAAEINNVHEFINENDLAEEPAAAEKPEWWNNDLAEEPAAAEKPEWNVDLAEEPAAAEEPGWNVDLADEPAAAEEPEWNIDMAEEAAVAEEPEMLFEQVEEPAVDIKTSLMSSIIIFFKRLWKKRSPMKDFVEVTENESIDADSEAEELERASTLSGVRLLTSPCSTGKTFLAANIAMANGSVNHPVTLVDLSPDRGTLTVLNPMLTRSDHDLWETWTSRNAPGVTVWTPQKYVSLQDIISLINNQAQSGAVLVDVPWRFPNIKDLLTQFNHVAVLDSDYHHWLQWDKEIDSWDGDIWLNQSDDDMNKLIFQLVREKFNKSVETTFPSFPEANKWLLQGRPLASDPQVSRFFIWSETEEKAC